MFVLTLSLLCCLKVTCFANFCYIRANSTIVVLFAGTLLSKLSALPIAVAVVVLFAIAVAVVVVFVIAVAVVVVFAIAVAVVVVFQPRSGAFSPAPVLGGGGLEAFPPHRLHLLQVPHLQVPYHACMHGAPLYESIKSTVNLEF
jgi:hypothetical protein